MNPARGQGRDGAQASETVMTCEVGQVPDAVAAAIQGYIDQRPKFGRGALGWLIARELREDGWLIVAPTGRATTSAAEHRQEH